MLADRFTHLGTRPARTARAGLPYVDSNMSIPAVPRSSYISRWRRMCSCRNRLWKTRVGWFSEHASVLHNNEAELTRRKDTRLSVLDVLAAVHHRGEQKQEQGCGLRELHFATVPMLSVEKAMKFDDTSGRRTLLSRLFSDYTNRVLFF